MIELKHLTKHFKTPGGTVAALEDIDLTIPDGDIFGIIGMSGAGKSTLVRCINLLERPDQGTVTIDGRQMQTLTPAELRAARRDIAMIFQQFNLLMQRTCLKNVCFPLELAGRPRAEAETRARQLLELVGLPDKAEPTPPSCQAASASGWPSPGHWPPTPRCCCATRPPAPWTPTQPTRSCS